MVPRKLLTNETINAKNIEGYLPVIAKIMERSEDDLKNLLSRGQHHEVLFNEFNTLYQFYALKVNVPTALENAALLACRYWHCFKDDKSFIKPFNKIFEGLAKIEEVDGTPTLALAPIDEYVAVSHNLATIEVFLAKITALRKEDGGDNEKYRRFFTGSYIRGALDELNLKRAVVNGVDVSSIERVIDVEHTYNFTFTKLAHQWEDDVKEAKYRAVTMLSNLEKCAVVAAVEKPAQAEPVQAAVKPHAHHNGMTKLFSRLKPKHHVVEEEVVTPVKTVMTR